MNEPFSDELISAYLDGELTADEQALVERTLVENAEYRRMFEDLRKLRADLQSLPRHTLDTNFADRVLQRAEIATRAAPADAANPSPAANNLPAHLAAAELRRWKQMFWAASTVAAGLLVALIAANQFGERQLASHVQQSRPMLLPDDFERPTDPESATLPSDPPAPIAGALVRTDSHPATPAEQEFRNGVPEAKRAKADVAPTNSPPANATVAMPRSDATPRDARTAQPTADKFGGQNVGDAADGAKPQPAAAPGSVPQDALRLSDAQRAEPATAPATAEVPRGKQPSVAERFQKSGEKSPPPEMGEAAKAREANKDANPIIAKSKSLPEAAPFFTTPAPESELKSAPVAKRMAAADEQQATAEPLTIRLRLPAAAATNPTVRNLLRSVAPEDLRKEIRTNPNDEKQAFAPTAASERAANMASDVAKQQSEDRNRDGGAAARRSLFRNSGRTTNVVQSIDLELTPQQLAATLDELARLSAAESGPAIPLPTSAKEEVANRPAAPDAPDAAIATSVAPAKPPPPAAVPQSKPAAAGLEAQDGLADKKNSVSARSLSAGGAGPKAAAPAPGPAPSSGDASSRIRLRLVLEFAAPDAAESTDAKPKSDGD